MEEKRTIDELVDTTADRVGDHLNQIFQEHLEENGTDKGIEMYFKLNKRFRIAKRNTIVKILGYTFGCKSELVKDPAFRSLTPTQKALIPDTDPLFFILGEIEGHSKTVPKAVVHTHWLPEAHAFAQMVSCDWWDIAEGEVLEEWGIDYDDVIKH